MKMPTMRIAGWLLLAVGLALGLYGKYFQVGHYRVYGVVIAMAGTTLLLWRGSESKAK